MGTAVEERIRQLTQPMLRKKLFVVLSTATAAASGDAIAVHLQDHLAYMIGLEKEGRVFASGPLTDPGGTPR